MKRTKFKQLNKYYYRCEVTGFKYLKISETDDIIKLEATTNKKNITFKSKFKHGEFKNQKISKYKKDVIFKQNLSTI